MEPFEGGNRGNRRLDVGRIRSVLQAGFVPTDGEYRTAAMERSSRRQPPRSERSSR